MSQYYLVVLVPQPGGGWSAQFPDFSGCSAKGERIEVAIDNSMRAVSDAVDDMRRQGSLLPPPTAYEKLRTDEVWAADRGIDWSTAVISLVRVA